MHLPIQWTVCRMIVACWVAGLFVFPGISWADPVIRPAIRIVAAENFYGDVAHQLAGANASVTSILSNPDQDPHLFEASPSVARSLAHARIVIYNGADYDPWMAKLLSASPRADRKTIVVADLVHKKAGDNPHIWYDPPMMPSLARALSASLIAADPAHTAEYERRLADFLEQLKPIEDKVEALRKRFAGVPVTATEPVFGYMAASVGLDMHNERFQLAVMNNTEPSASDIAQFETDLQQHRVRLLIYNSQASDAAARRLLRIAQQAKVSVIGVTETKPAGKTYQSWMLSELDALDHALSAEPS
jgi:zinc/manganese transport system substrate-binding protein